MELMYGILLLVLVFGVAFLLRKRKNEEQETGSSSDHGKSPTEENPGAEGSETRDIDYAEEFYAHLQGREVIDAVKTYNPMDVGIIQSVLYENGIHSLVKNFQTGSLFPGVAISGYTDIKISIVEEDRERTKLIMQELIEEMRGQQESKTGDAVRGVLETTIGGYVLANKDTRLLPELLI